MGKRLTVEQQFEVLSAIWAHGEPGFVFLPWIPGHLSREQRRRGWNESRAFDWGLEEDKAAALEHIRAHTKDELYFTPAKFLKPDRREQHVAEGHVLFADLDEVDPLMIDREVRPTIAWESSPDRYQAVWFMAGMNFHAYDAGGINHRLTKFLGADPSGWDAPQVLRVPGRLNYKPEYRAENDGAPVPGTLLWSHTDDIYTWDSLEQYLPSAESLGISTTSLSEIEDDEIDSVDRARVWARVRLRVSPPVRRYMSMRSHQISDDMDRSEIVWQISCDLADAGCSVSEIVAIVRHTPWNKYEGRGDELFRLKMGAVRAKEHSLQNASEDTLEGDTVDTLEAPSTPLWFADVAMGKITRPSWLVRNIWSKGGVGFIAGQPKSYKSYLALDLAISVASGRPFLNDEQFSTVPSRVLYLQEEDSLPIVLLRAEQVIEQKAPELSPKGLITSLGGDTPERAADAPRTLSELFWSPPAEPLPLALHVRTGFTVSNDVWQAWLDEFIAEHDFDLVVIDTLGTTVGDVDTDKSGPLNERVLKPLKQIAENRGCAIAVVHHNRKPNDNGKTRSGQQMLGSVALHAWVENALYVQSKDTLGPGQYEIKVERENKLAEDFKFRVRIPQMWVERRGNEGRRQDWQPEVLSGWGDAENAGEVKAAHTAKRITGQGGIRMAERVAALGKGGQPLMLAEIAKLTEHTENQVMSQIKRGLIDGNWEETEDGLFIALTL